EAVKDRVRSTPAPHLQHLEFDPRISLQKAQVELRPVDKKNHKKRREQIKMLFSLVVKPEDDGQLFVTVPKLGQPPLTFYVYNKDELHQQAAVELAAWLDGMSLDQLMEFRHARAETLETLEVDVPLKKPKEQASGDSTGETPEAFWALREIGVNITAQTSEGRWRKLYRRDQYVEDVLRTLASPRHNSVLITGPSEVGKTAVIHEIVRRIQKKECDDHLWDRQ